LALISTAVRSTSHFDQRRVQQVYHSKPRRKALKHRDISLARIPGPKSSNKWSQRVQRYDIRQNG
jgi:hypothetical protein